MGVELLSPAGNMEKLKAAVYFGADAVYLSGTDYGLRASADNFTIEEMNEAFKFLHERGKKGYLTVNIYARNYDFKDLGYYLDQVKEVSPDALIVSDPGIFKFIKDKKLNIPVHISTQANTTNYMAVRFWQELGAERVVLARELTRDEIKFIAENVSCDLEVFVHGAMCISHSGRCVLSNYFNKKDSNRGECTHPCRWKYHLVEETRPGEYLPVFEDKRGTYIYNSKDLCLIEHIGIVVDTHVLRIAQRLGLSDSDNPEKIEKDLTHLITKDRWGKISHQIIQFGRQICTARKPKCHICPFPDICKFYIDNNKKI